MVTVAAVFVLQGSANSETQVSVSVANDGSLRKLEPAQSLLLTVSHRHTALRTAAGPGHRSLYFFSLALHLQTSVEQS